MVYKEITKKTVVKKGDVLLAPVATEKCIRQIETDNILCFIVGKNATKSEVKSAVEKQFSVKVSRVNIQNGVDGRKKAYVRLGPGSLAADVSADLGFI